MTYKFNKEQHTAKIKAGLKTAKKKGKKLGRPKGGKIKGEDEVMYYYNRCLQARKDMNLNFRINRQMIADEVGISKSTVQNIINKYKQNGN